MRASEAIPLGHPLDGDPEHCCSGGKHNFHFRPGAPRTPGHLIWCCCKSVLTEIEPERTEQAFAYDSEEVGEAFTEWCASAGIEARDDQEYRQLRAAFTAGMNEVSRYGHE
jgi:hypothetical protein